MRTQLSKSRFTAFCHQNGRCYYCNSPMWLSDEQQFASQFGISLRQARQLRCTAEHLLARQDGGSASQHNIAAACRFCNHSRHHRPLPPTPDEFKVFVQKRMAAGRWHAKWLKDTQQPPAIRPI